MSGINWLNQPLTFKIVWNAGNVQYYIGTTLMITHSSMAWGTVAMAPVIIDGHAAGVVAKVDWMRLTPYAAAGTYTSAVFDAGAAVTWLKLTASASVVSGTTLTHSYRTGNTPDPDATWTSFTTVPANGVITGSSQYIQFRSAADVEQRDEDPDPERRHGVLQEIGQRGNALEVCSFEPRRGVTHPASVFTQKGERP